MIKNAHPLKNLENAIRNRSGHKDCEDIEFMFEEILAKKIEILNQEVCFASPEDVIIHKIFAGRPRDLMDNMRKVAAV